MNRMCVLLLTASTAVIASTSACNKQTTGERGKGEAEQQASGASEATAAAEPKSPAKSAAAHPAPTHEGEAGAHGASDGGSGRTLKLAGLTLTVPEGWQRGTITPGPFAPVAVFEIPPVGEDKENAQVRITHYPNMKGMDDQNLQRWLGQVTKPDGSSYSLDEANLTVTEQGNVRIKMIDLSGTVKATMRATPRPDSRMIAAIVDHPQGPHFIVAYGGAATMNQAADAVRAFIASAKVE